MDAGTAAVLGALAGSVATIGAAMATGWAQREGARITARSEHRRERREPRYNAYKEFIAEATRMRNASAVWGIDLSHTSEVDDEIIDYWRLVENALKNKARDVVLAGPTKVTKAVIELERLATELVVEFMTYRDVVGQEPLQSEMRRQLLLKAREFESALVSFKLSAQVALDDDGS
ncbi:hypothetical protein [Streptomyces tubercidicus]|uniref:hypothetical protein n=1 Tax=Streptomyces tubercidicus TaxID=47759 RepID=UPI0034676EB1